MTAHAQNAQPTIFESIAPSEEEFSCHECTHGCAHAKQFRARFAAGLNPDGSPIAQAVLPADNLDTDLLHNDLTLEINPTTRWIGGSNTMTMRAMVNNLTRARIRLQNSFTITGLRCGNTTTGGGFIDNVYLYVYLDRPYNLGEEFTITVDYNGFPQNNGFDSISFSTQGGQPIVATLSETDFANTWWPTKDDNRDKSTADLRFIIPSIYSIASNGSLISTTDLGNGKSEWHWKTEYQTATYLYSFAMTNYNRFTATYDYGTGTMPLEFFIYPASNTTANRNAWLQSVQMLDTFRPIYGLYPFINEKYGIYQFQFGGGMEHQTMTGQGSFGESLTAHELAHQWWGDMVTCSTWNNIWLNEGFATYSEALWLERKPGSSGELALHAAMASRRPSSVNGSVYIHEPLDNGNINRIFSTSFSYRKPAWVLHMLRKIIGEETFFEVLAEYRAAYEYSSATTEDFQAVCESVSGQDLTWFFDQWIYNIGAPAYQRAWRQVTVNGQNYVELMVKQGQSASYPIFTMPLDLVLTVGGSPVNRTIWNNAQTEWYVIPVGGSATALLLDPTPWVLATTNSTTSFTEGPPVVVQSVPAPDEVLDSGELGSITVYFQKTITASASDVSLVRDGSGAVPFSFQSIPSNKSIVIEPQSALESGAYTLTIADTVRETATNKQLDGEVLDGALPSGDGQPGGSAVIRFSIAPPPICLGDADLSGTVDFADITAALAQFGANYPPSTKGMGDADGNGTVDFADITVIIQNFGTVCGG